jgi:hypothetical protein
MEGSTGFFHRAGVNLGEIGARMGLISLTLSIPPIKVSRGGGISLNPSNQEEKVSGSGDRGSFSCHIKTGFLIRYIELIFKINFD